VQGAAGKGGRATLKMLRRKSKTQFVNQISNTQNATELLNYLKCIAQQQLMLRTQVFTKKFLSAKNARATFLNKKTKASGGQSYSNSVTKLHN
jgi:hypothetical protein